MASNLFARGYEASREEKERQDRVRENMGKKLWKFFLTGDGDEASVHFLTEEPVNFYEHNLKRGDKYEQYTCTGNECPFCKDGDKPTYKGAYLIVDHREFDYTDKNGKKQNGKDQVRLYVQGMKVVSQLDRISNRYGLSNRDVDIVRLGNGTQTTYTIERGDECKYTTKEVKNLLPEKLRDDYDGTEDSLMSIVEEQLLMMTKDYNPDDEDDEEDTDDGRSKLISMNNHNEDSESSGRKLFKKSSGSAKSLLKRS